MKKRVVVTGIGVLACNGEGKEEYWKALKEGRHGFRKISLFDTSKFNVDIAGEIPNFDPTKYLGTKGLRTLDRSTKLLLSAAKLAIEDSQLKITEENTQTIGVSVGCTLGSLKSINDFDLVTLNEGPRYTNPALFPNTVINSPASQVSIWFKIKGFNTTISSGFTASLDAIKYAYDFIQMDRAKVVLAGGVEELCEPTFYGFHELGFLSGSKKGQEWVSCPFDKRRNGVTFAEGACLLVLEEYEYAKKRGANILAEISGFGQCFYPYRIDKYEPKGKGLREAIKTVFDEAECSTKDIDYICANANSTQAADLIEVSVIKDVFGRRANQIPITSIKSMVGETYSVSGALSVVGSIGSICNNFIPINNGFVVEDEKCSMDFTKVENNADKINKVLINVFSPSGNNSCAVLSRI